MCSTFPSQCTGLSGQPSRLSVVPRQLPGLPWGMQNTCLQPECEVVSRLHRRSIPLRLSSASVVAGHRLMQRWRTWNGEGDLWSLPNRFRWFGGRQQVRNCNLGARCVRAAPVGRRQGHFYQLPKPSLECHCPIATLLVLHGIIHHIIG